MSEKVKCQYCSNNVELGMKQNDIMDHLVVLRSTSNHFHIHGPILDKALMKKFIMMIAKEAGLEIEDDKPTASATDYKKIQ
jgi:PP-loop superfamily ATP-utilizing enzyme